MILVENVVRLKRFIRLLQRPLLDHFRALRCEHPGVHVSHKIWKILLDNSVPNVCYVPRMMIEAIVLQLKQKKVDGFAVIFLHQQMKRSKAFQVLNERDLKLNTCCFMQVIKSIENFVELKRIFN